MVSFTGESRVGCYQEKYHQLELSRVSTYLKFFFLLSVIYSFLTYMQTMHICVLMEYQVIVHYLCILNSQANDIYFFRYASPPYVTVFKILSSQF